MSVSQIAYKTITYYEDDNCKISLEDVEDNVFVHVAFYKFSRPILQNAIKVWAEIKAKCYWYGYPAIYTYTYEDRMAKFFYGSEELGSFNFNHKQYKVLKWELN